MASTASLYTAEILGLATALAQFPLADDLPLRTEARSRSCGSSLRLGLALNPEGRVARVGLRSQACAIGQASAAIFAQSAAGRSAKEIVATARGLQQWIAGTGPLPQWQGLPTIAAAREYPGRHGALMLPWTAALELLSTSGAEG